MSESVMKVNCTTSFAYDISLHNITNGNTNVEVKHNNENGNNEIYYPQEVLRKSAYGMFEVDVKEENEVKNETLNIQAVEIKLEKEIQIFEEPIAFTGVNDLVKHDLTYSEENSYNYGPYGKASSHNDSLIDHLITHTGAKQCQCNQFSKTFSHEKVLTEHHRTHTGEKTFQCSQCDKAFPNISNLLRHQRTHTSEKTFQCSHCDKAFLQNSYLIQTSGNTHWRQTTSVQPM
ncbi:unnamed protein product [Meganyctiphanes norvegica]|uniref:C2H2-type domain-containing protein n=1 Tax=Meganyctiphanes norvegica TaxID=48144 RepID=A0AAV2S1X3_MEGNR